MYVMAPEGVSTCRSRSGKGEWVHKVYDYVIACSSLRGIISDMHVIEVFESRSHKAVTFAVERGKAGIERAKIAEGKRKVGEKEKKEREKNKDGEK